MRKVWFQNPIQDGRRKKELIWDLIFSGKYLSRIDHDGANDNYRALALYIADAGIRTDPSEKTLHSWYIGGDADNYLEGMFEVEAIQDEKPDIEKKTYHLVVSFGPEDEPKLSKESKPTPITSKSALGRCAPEAGSGQNLRIKRFVGTSKNAVWIQIYTDLTPCTCFWLIKSSWLLLKYSFRNFFNSFKSICSSATPFWNCSIHEHAISISIMLSLC